jgi:hypothetical protein
MIQFLIITDIKRAESMKVEKKSATRRVPSFTTRRRTQSFRRPGGPDGPAPQDIPPVEIRGVLDRKHELMSGGKRAAIRSWKTYYTGKQHDTSRGMGRVEKVDFRACHPLSSLPSLPLISQANQHISINGRFAKYKQTSLYIVAVN